MKIKMVSCVRILLNLVNSSKIQSTYLSFEKLSLSLSLSLPPSPQPPPQI